MRAEFIKQLDGFAGDARLYRLSRPLREVDWDGGVRGEYEFVVVSAAVVVLSGPETYVFGANEGGEVVSWRELDGSFRGGLDHAEALRGAGYEVQP